MVAVRVSTVSGLVSSACAPVYPRYTLPGYPCVPSVCIGWWSLVCDTSLRKPPYVSVVLEVPINIHFPFRYNLMVAGAAVEDSVDVAFVGKVQVLDLAVEGGGVYLAVLISDGRGAIWAIHESPLESLQVSAKRFGEIYHPSMEEDNPFIAAIKAAKWSNYFPILGESGG